MSENTSAPNAPTYTHSFRNDSGYALSVNTVIRIPANSEIAGVFRNGAPFSFTYNASIGTVAITSSLDTGAASITNFVVATGCPADLNNDGVVEDSDFVIFANSYNILDCSDPSMPAGCPGDLNFDGAVDDTDFVLFAGAYDQLVCP